MLLSRPYKAFVLGLGLLVILMACNLFTRPAAGPDAQTLQTLAAQTVQAALTAQSSTSAPPAATAGAHPTTTSPTPTTAAATSAPQPTSTTAPPSPTPQPPTPTPIVPTATPTPKPCNLATFIADVTVPDNTEFQPGEAFTKTWRLKNVGTCTWQNYSVVFDHGDAMGGAPVVPLAAVVAPGQEVDVSVNLTAPTNEGTYQGFWRLRDAHGVVFGLTTGNPFWVKIKVVAPTATPVPTPTPTATLPPPALLVFDFYQQAPNATWYNGHSQTLPFPGSTSDSRGFARYADNALLEDGHRYRHVLQTHPEWVNNGLITGHFPPFTLSQDGRFQAKIGFIALSNGACGVGDVEFRLYLHRPPAPPHRIAQWHATCDGTLQNVEVPLSASSQPIRLILQVAAGSSSAQDWAVWVNPVVSSP